MKELQNEDTWKPEIIKETSGFKAGIIENTWLKIPPELFKIGWGNGYVSLPVGHPWMRLHYDNIPVDVHGGLTFKERIKGVTWIGFDTAHAYDNRRDQSREYVIKETLRLMAQAIKANRKKSVNKKS